MSLQFNNRRRRRRRRTRLKREVIITIRVLLALLVSGLIVYGSINVYSYFNKKNKDVMGELPTEPNTDNNPEDDTNSNNSSTDGVPGNNNDKEDEVLDNIENTEQDKGESDKSDTDKSETDKSETDKSEADKSEDDKSEPDKSETDIDESDSSENNKPDNNETNNSVTDDKKPDKNESQKDESYFDDAVFIGDSRTEGLKLYSGLKNAIFYAEKGLDVATIFEHKIKINGSDMTIIDALNKQTFGKVYINLGINEMGWPYDSEFIKHYGKVIDAIKESQPTAEIYLQSIIHISREKDKNPDYFKNSTIIRRNKLLKELAKEKEINYIDPNEVLIDDKGYLIEGASVDGVHLNKTYCEKWKEFLIDNIVK